VISFIDVSHDFGEFQLKDVTFTVERGEYFVIIGPTGAGKTLILESIAGFHPPGKGRILLTGVEGGDLTPEARGVGFVYQDYALFPHMTVWENVAFGLDMRKTPESEVKQRVTQILDSLDIGSLKDRYPSTLSGGESQRVALARALVIEPDILLLDEPLSALDTRTRENLRGELKRQHRIHGTTTVHVTHDQTEALLLADRVAIIIDGEIVQVGPPSEVFSMPVNLNVAHFTGIDNILEGKVAAHNGSMATIDVNDFQVYAVTGITEGDVYVLLRPEDVILSQTPFDSSARNVLETVIIGVQPHGSVYRVTLKNGISVLVTKQSVEQLGLAEGVLICASFKATTPHVLPR